LENPEGSREKYQEAIAPATEYWKTAEIKAEIQRKARGINKK
jgi:hypothetical protein